MTTETDRRVLRAAVHAAVVTAGAHLGVTHAQAHDLASLLLQQAELTDIGTVRLTTGETVDDALGRFANDPDNAHLFGSTPPHDDGSTKKAQRSALRALSAADRLAQANGEGVTHAWVRTLRKGRTQ